LEFEFHHKMKVVPLHLICHPTKFGEFWSLTMDVLSFYKIQLREKKWKFLKSWARSTFWRQPALIAARLAHRLVTWVPQAGVASTQPHRFASAIKPPPTVQCFHPPPSIFSLDVVENRAPPPHQIPSVSSHAIAAPPEPVRPKQCLTLAHLLG
jgi:hypothetical protein